MTMPVYLDYAATTPVDERVANEMWRYLTADGIFGNPASSSHRYGWEALQAVETARNQVAALINAKPQEIVWTSGATESDNLAIKGVARFYQHKGRHIITGSAEHKAVLDSCASLEKEGFEVTYLNPKTDGCVDLDKLTQAIREDTVLVSHMHVNNETGIIADVAKMAEICHERDVLLHVDAAQSAGKILIDVKAMDIDLLSLSAHKVYGPKGVGALYVRSKPRVRLLPLIDGGGHERGMRSGTLATHQIVGMGKAFAVAKAELETEHQRLTQLNQLLLRGLSAIPKIRFNGDRAHAVPNIVNVSFEYVEGESLLLALADLAVSTGSACSSASIDTSHVLRALQVPDELAHSSLRISIGRFTQTADVQQAVQSITRQVAKLREMSPLWADATAHHDPL